jgi:hypothetical protein
MVRLRPRRGGSSCFFCNPGLREGTLSLQEFLIEIETPSATELTTKFLLLGKLFVLPHPP